MERGRSLESNGWRLESSHRAKRVSIRSSISSISESDFGFSDAAVEEDDSAIFGFRFDNFISSFSNKKVKVLFLRCEMENENTVLITVIIYAVLGSLAACALRQLLSLC